MSYVNPPAPETTVTRPSTSLSGFKKLISRHCGKREQKEREVALTVIAIKNGDSGWVGVD